MRDRGDGTRRVPPTSVRLAKRRFRRTMTPMDYVFPVADVVAWRGPGRRGGVAGAEGEDRRGLRPRKGRGNRGNRRAGRKSAGPRCDHRGTPRPAATGRRLARGASAASHRALGPSGPVEAGPVAEQKQAQEKLALLDNAKQQLPTPSRPWPPRPSRAATPRSWNWPRPSWRSFRSRPAATSTSGRRPSTNWSSRSRSRWARWTPSCRRSRRGGSRPTAA